jgi:hypothetical protein
MTTARAWQQAFARQAEVDFLAWQQLQPASKLPQCQSLHFLQMASEKLVKAYLCEAGSKPADLQASHAYTAKNLHLVIRQQISLTSASRPKGLELFLRHCKHLAREIELLHPQVTDGGKRPDNCEYPWEDAKHRLHVPADWHFQVADLLFMRAGRGFLRLMRDAIRRLVRSA